VCGMGLNQRTETVASIRASVVSWRDEIEAAATAAGIVMPSIALMIPWASEGVDNTYWLQVRNAIYSVAKDEGCAVFDWWKLTGSIGTSDVNDPYGLAFDSIHPNDKGHKMIGEAFGAWLIEGIGQDGNAQLDSVNTDQLVDGAVTTDKIAANAVTAAKIANGVVSLTQMSFDPMPNMMFYAGAMAASRSTSLAVQGSVGTRTSAWSLPDAADNGVTLGFRAPSWWNTFHVDVKWHPSSTNTGAVAWSSSRVNAAVGGNATSWGSTPVVTTDTANGATGVAQEFRVLTGVSCTPGGDVIVTVERAGADAGDTFTGIVRLLSVCITRAS
jgi:hypothetical protein